MIHLPFSSSHKPHSKSQKFENIEVHIFIVIQDEDDILTVVHLFVIKSIPIHKSSRFPFKPICSFIQILFLIQFNIFIALAPCLPKFITLVNTIIIMYILSTIKLIFFSIDFVWFPLTCAQMTDILQQVY